MLFFDKSINIKVHQGELDISVSHHSVSELMRKKERKIKEHSNWYSSACKKDKHCVCSSLKCVCTCHKRGAK